MHHCQMNWEPILTDLFSEFLVVSEAAAQGATCLTHLSMVPAVFGVECLDAVQPRRTVLVW
jgi:hypothetical protein